MTNFRLMQCTVLLQILLILSSCKLHDNPKDHYTYIDTSKELHCHTVHGCDYAGSNSYPGSWDEECLQGKKKEILAFCYEKAFDNYTSSGIFNDGIETSAEFSEEDIKNFTEQCYYDTVIIGGGEGWYDHCYIDEGIGVCGPDVSKQLIKVLLDVEESFNGNRWTHQQKHELCYTPIINFSDLYHPLDFALNAINFADICELNISGSSWLSSKKYINEKCGTPVYNEGTNFDRENMEISPCGSSVQVGEHCYLSGTVNYAIVGKVYRLCHDEFGDDFDINKMKEQIQDYKEWLSVEDDYRPPTLWAEWGYNQLPLSKIPTGTAANRYYCTGRCPVDVSLNFTWNWLPYQDQCK